MNNDFFKLPDKFFGLNISFLKLFIAPFFVSLVALVGLNLIIIPKFSDLSKLNDSAKSIDKDIDLTTQKINYLSSVDQEQIKNDVDYLESAVLQEKNSYLLVGVIRNVADKYGFAVSSFSISSIEVKNDTSETLKVANKDVAVKMPIQVSLSGPTSKSVEIITALENTLPILFVDNLNISTNGEISGLDMTISSYYIAEKNDLVSGNLSLNDLVLTQEESDLIKTISGFTKASSDVSTGGTNEPFVKYDRTNPFTL
jgi:hypothetical protein